uniref:Uncharacterized protein n=1 Tax=Picea glauca TaxID=3330 RepID=A0A101M187_PICGL|nr:hypothetical protein ABT39_MTgene3730 [Picea glauca]QHR87389.1 hypothetical protein Q903MT_gene1399 [Picea sitchensis]
MEITSLLDSFSHTSFVLSYMGISFLFSSPSHYYLSLLVYSSLRGLAYSLLALPGLSLFPCFVRGFNTSLRCLGLSLLKGQYFVKERGSFLP